MCAAQGLDAIRAFGEHEHREVARGLAHIHEVALNAGTDSHPGLSRAVHDVTTWAVHVLQPHMAWEESWLYAEIDARTGTPWATRAARFDHAQIEALLSQVRLDEAILARTVTPATVTEARCHLIALEAVLRTHIEREQQLLLPVVDLSLERS